MKKRGMNERSIPERRLFHEFWIISSFRRVSFAQNVFYVFAKSLFACRREKKQKNISLLKKQKNVGSSIIFLVRVCKMVHAKMDAFKINKHG